jgi:hypothetical protein
MPSLYHDPAAVAALFFNEVNSSAPLKALANAAASLARESLELSSWKTPIFSRPVAKSRSTAGESNRHSKALDDLMLQQGLKDNSTHHPGNQD